MAVKQGSQAPVNHATMIKGTVLEVDGNIALVQTSMHQTIRVRADMLRGKSIAPQPGESWLLDQPYGVGWMFAVPLNYTGGDQDFTPTAPTNGWSDVAGVYQPSGYMLDAEGWVNCEGRMHGGTANQSAFTLPKGYRPGGRADFIVCVGTGSGVVSVRQDGTVTPAGSQDFSLEQIRFLAQN